MRILALLAALLLLALQVQAEPRQETAEQVPAQDMPEAKDQDQDQPMDKVQDMAISFAGFDRLTRDALGLQKAKICKCRKTWICPLFERHSGSCYVNYIKYRLCCR